MKQIITTLLLLVTIYVGFGQRKINIILKRQLDSVMALDQKYRDTLNLLMTPQNADSAARSLSLTVAQARNHYWHLQNRVDSQNLVFAESVIAKFGYPGKSLVGAPANEAAWYILQHSAKIHQYIGLIKKAADAHELPFYLYAMMLDRDLVDLGKEQVYGTQISCHKFKSVKDECIVWPVKDAATVNQRRKQAGFTSTVEQNAARFGVVYRVITLDQAQ